MASQTDSTTVLSLGIGTREGDELAAPLDQAGFSVERAAPTTDRLDRLSPSVDCVVCPYRLGDSDGLSILETVRQSYPNLPFVLCVRDGSEAVASSAIEAGVSGYVPMDDGVPSDLGERVRRAIESASPRSGTDHRVDEVYRRISDAFFALDDEWRITHVNEAGEEVLRDAAVDCESSDTLLGRTLWEMVPDAVGTTFQKRYEEAMATQEPITFEEYYEPTETWFELRVYPDDDGLSIYFTDVTDRKERVDDLRQYRTLVETAGDPMYVLDDDGYIEMANEAMMDALDADRETVVGSHASEFMAEGDFEQGTAILQALLSDAEQERATYEITAVTTGGERILAEINVAPLQDESGAIRGSVGVTRDLSERKAREEELSYRKALLEAQAETTVDGLLVVDEDRNVRYHNENFLELWDIPPAVAAGRCDERLLDYAHDSLADPEEFREKVAHLYEHPETECRDTIQLADGRWFDRYSAPVVHDDEHYGRLWVFRDITDRKVRERALEQQRDELTQLNRINTITRETTRALQETSSRGAIETAVCDHLTDSYLYQTAWIGTTKHGTDGDQRVEPQTVAGVDETYLSGIPAGRNGPAETALRSGEVAVVDDVATAELFPDGRRELALEHGHHTLAAVPLEAGTTTHGVLAVYAPAGHTIDDREVEILDDLGKIIALAIQRVTSRRSLTADSAVELQLRIADETSPFGDVTTELDCELLFDRWVPIDDGNGIQYLTVRGTSPSVVCTHLSTHDLVEDASVVRDPTEDTDRDGLVEVLVGDQCENPIDTLVTHGASITSARATGGSVHASVEIAPEGDVRAIVGAVRDAIGDADLVSKRLVDRPIATIPEIRQRVSDQLTRKQEAVLRTTYVRGYHAWPRESTAEEIADTMDIASSTFHYHLRHAIEKLLTVFFDGVCENCDTHHRSREAK